MNNTRVYLAFKHTPPGGFWMSAFHWITAFRLVTRYPHGGIVQGGWLYHTKLSTGARRERFDDNPGWDLFDTGSDADMEEVFRELEGNPYDVFGLLAFILPWRISDSSRMYCYKLMWRMVTGQNPRFKVVPETLLAWAAQQQAGNRA